VVVDLTELRINVSAVASIASVKRLLAALDTASSQQPHPTQHQRTVPVGVFVKEEQGQQHSDTTNKKLSAALGFPAICPSEAALGKLVPSSSSTGDPAAPLTTNKAAAAAAAADDDGALPSGGVTLFEGNVRSGQQVFAAPGQSLLVYGSVNPGGEVDNSAPPKPF
jgi:septum formation inhibitor MinC